MQLTASQAVHQMKLHSILSDIMITQKAPILELFAFINDALVLGRLVTQFMNILLQWPNWGTWVDEERVLLTFHTLDAQLQIKITFHGYIGVRLEVPLQGSMCWWPESLTWLRGALLGDSEVHCLVGNLLLVGCTDEHLLNSPYTMLLQYLHILSKSPIFHRSKALLGLECVIRWLFT